MRGTILPLLFLISTLCAAQTPTSQRTSSTQGAGLNVGTAINKIRPSTVQIRYRLEYKFVNRAAPAFGRVLPAGSGVLADTIHVITARHVVEYIDNLPQILMQSPVGPNGPIDRQSIKTQLLVGFAMKQGSDEHDNWIFGNFVSFPATVFLQGSKADVAILQLEPNTLESVVAARPMSINGAEIQAIRPVIPVFAHELADEGEMIAASGFPLEVPSLVTNVGWIGSKFALDGDQRLQLGSLLVNPGNSGGPVYRVRDGAIIGIAKGYWIASGDVRAVPSGAKLPLQAELNSGLSEIVPIHEALDLLQRRGQ